MNAIDAYIQFTPDLISHSGELGSESAETFRRNYMTEFRDFTGRVLSAYLRISVRGAAG